ncbi:MAG TPA: BcpO-related WXXGXW repeat protein [Desulfuromonadales bacterium]|nr:BcpO-related WXXGXW repeat protein [Desulfuromonadales bacterium]
MKKPAVAFLLCILAVSSICSAEAGVYINVPPPSVIFKTPPLFLSPPDIGYYVGVDTPYDIVLISGVYYLFQGDNWYRSRHYNGPWTYIRHDRLPLAIRKHDIERIRHHRNEVYSTYQENREHFRGRHFTPGYERNSSYSEERHYERGVEREERYNRRDEHREYNNRERRRE